MAEALLHYTQRRDLAAARVAELDRRSRALSLARVVVFVGGAAFGVATHLYGWGTGGWAGVLVALVVFVVLYAVHDRVIEQRAHFDRTRAWADAGLGRLDGRWARPAAAGEPVNPEDHPYADDLDLFGARSLMQSIDTTRTLEGRALLTAWLSAPAPAAEVRLRQTCARELGRRIEVCEALGVEGARLAEDPAAVGPLLRWAEGPTEWRPGVALRVAALLLPVVTFGLLVFGARLPIPRASWALPLLIQLGLSMRWKAATMAAIHAASNHHAALSRFERMFATLEGARFEVAELEALRGSLAGARASSRALGRIVGFVDARRNEAFRFVIGPLLSWDLNCAIALERWRVKGGPRLRRDLDALARIEALVALGVRAFERPTDAWPELVESGAPVLEASALAHPLIAVEKAVRNDVTLGGEHASVLLVTGSNMSGKSTLLRSIGANVVLALAGAPVRARALRTSAFDVRTSMRVRDSLSEGVSHFFAELQRLKLVVDAADAAARPGTPPVLFLLDEILHGTNSRERHLGARAIVHRLAERPACGAVSTHDLALADLATELPGRVANVHFREDVARDASGKETMTFDYRLRDGVVTTSNALRLMRIVGIDVPAGLGEPPAP